MVDHPLGRCPTFDPRLGCEEPVAVEPDAHEGRGMSGEGRGMSGEGRGQSSGPLSLWERVRVRAACVRQG